MSFELCCFGQYEIFDIFPPSKTECPVLTWHKNKERVFDHKQLPVLIPRGQSRANKYEKELMHPIQNLVGGELARALLIQVQKLKLDIETAMLELDQILRANEINFAILAALPAFVLSLILLMVVRAWFKQDTRAEGRGRAARIQRRLLMVEIERGIMQIQKCKDQGLEKDAQCMYGLVLYSLDRLYCALERHAKATGEWICLRQDIYDLAKPELETARRLIITSRMAVVSHLNCFTEKEASFLCFYVKYHITTEWRIEMSWEKSLSAAAMQCKAKQLKFLSPQIITGQRALAIEEKSTIIYDSRHPTSFFRRVNLEILS
ncbi:hypothetical protein M9H77_13883 [Catharanthus roseus]|uniref:Uncharacterized protein n=1 Tax=Catharanthus roseus TaxID=4058 RepID=A0ACC0BLG1_CATRO|nr:hypothetical protein M9H77_13883 [Catharanthus roseus]